jgi:hypothetical protein
MTSYEELWEIFISLGKAGLSCSHYDLAAKTKVKNCIEWKDFLINPKTADYIRTEMDIIRGAAINQMIQTSPDSRSVGQSQLLNALQKITDDSGKKEGPTFIYCHVPLNDQQKAAPNIRECNASGIILEDNGVYVIDEA